MVGGGQAAMVRSREAEMCAWNAATSESDLPGRDGGSVVLFESLTALFDQPPPVYFIRANRTTTQRLRGPACTATPHAQQPSLPQQTFAADPPTLPAHVFDYGTPRMYPSLMLCVTRHPPSVSSSRFNKLSRPSLTKPICWAPLFLNSNRLPAHTHIDSQTHTVYRVFCPCPFVPSLPHLSILISPIVRAS